MEILHITTQYFGSMSVEVPMWIVAGYAIIFVIGLLAAVTKD